MNQGTKVVGYDVVKCLDDNTYEIRLDGYTILDGLTDQDRGMLVNALTTPDKFLPKIVHNLTTTR